MVVHGSVQIQRCWATLPHHANNMHVGVFVCVSSASADLCAQSHAYVHAEILYVCRTECFSSEWGGDIFLMRR